MSYSTFDNPGFLNQFHDAFEARRAAFRRRRRRCRRDRANLNAAAVLAALIVGVGLLDVLSTEAFLAAGHVEANPLVAGVQALMGSWWAAAKLLVHGALAMFVLWLPSRAMIWNARAGIAVYAVVIASNFTLAGMTA